MFILENGCVSTWKWPGVGGLPLCVCVCMCVFQYVWEGELYSHADGAWWTPYTFGFLAINKLTIFIHIYTGFPHGSEVKVSACNAGDPGSIPGSGRSPGEGNGNPLQDSCLENPMDREAWWATVHGVAKSRTRLSDFTYLLTYTESESHSVMSNSLRHHGPYSPWNSPGHNTGVSSYSLLWGSFPTQGSNPDLLHCRQILYQLRHKGNLYLYPPADKAETLWLDTNM